MRKGVFFFFQFRKHHKMGMLSKITEQIKNSSGDLLPGKLDLHCLHLSTFLKLFWPCNSCCGVFFSQSPTFQRPCTNRDISVSTIDKVVMRPECFNSIGLWNKTAICPLEIQGSRKVLGNSYFITQRCFGCIVEIQMNVHFSIFRALSPSLWLLTFIIMIFWFFCLLHTIRCILHRYSLRHKPQISSSLHCCCVVQRGQCCLQRSTILKGWRHV